MSETPNADRLRGAAHNVLSMLEDPHPGLASWHSIFAKNAVVLRDLLVELYPLEADKTDTRIERARKELREALQVTRDCENGNALASFAKTAGLTTALAILEESR